QVAASDPDGDVLTYSFVPIGGAGLPDGLSLNPSTGLLSGTLTYASAGVYAVRLCASDNYQSICRDFAWTVANVNRAPILANPGDQIQKFGTVVSLPLSATDPDGTAVTYSATNLPSGVTVNPSTGLISGVPSFSSVGVH